MFTTNIADSFHFKNWCDSCFPKPSILEKARESALRGDVARLDQYRQHGVDLSLIDEDSSHPETLLHAAARGGQTETAKFLFYHYVEIAGQDFQNEDGETPLHLAVKNQVNEALLELLIKKHPEWLLIKDRRGETPLHVATANARTPCKILVDLFRQTEQINHSAVLHRDSLVSANVDGNTLLHSALKAGQAQFILDVNLIDLVFHHNDLEQKNNKGDTPLHLAIQSFYYCNELSLIERLLHVNSSVLNLANANGDVPFVLAVDQKEKVFKKSIVTTHNHIFLQPYGAKDSYNKLLRSILEFEPVYPKHSFKNGQPLMHRLIHDSTIEQKTIEAALFHFKNYDVFQEDSMRVSLVEALFNQPKIALLFKALQHKTFASNAACLVPLCLKLCNSKTFVVALIKEQLGQGATGFVNLQNWLSLNDSNELHAAHEKYQEFAIAFINKCSPVLAKVAFEIIRDNNKHPLIKNGSVDSINMIKGLLEKRASGETLPLVASIDC